MLVDVVEVTDVALVTVIAVDVVELNVVEVVFKGSEKVLVDSETDSESFSIVDSEDDAEPLSIVDSEDDSETLRIDDSEAKVELFSTVDSKADSEPISIVDSDAEAETFGIVDSVAFVNDVVSSSNGSTVGTVSVSAAVESVELATAAPDKARLSDTLLVVVLGIELLFAEARTAKSAVRTVMVVFISLSLSRLDAAASWTPSCSYTTSPAQIAVNNPSLLLLVTTQKPSKFLFIYFKPSQLDRAGESAGTAARLAHNSMSPLREPKLANPSPATATVHLKSCTKVAAASSAPQPRARSANNRKCPWHNYSCRTSSQKGEFVPQDSSPTQPATNKRLPGT